MAKSFSEWEIPLEICLQNDRNILVTKILTTYKVINYLSSLQFLNPWLVSIISNILNILLHPVYEIEVSYELSFYVVFERA